MFFRVILPSVIIGLQLLVYFRTIRWLKRLYPHRSWLRHVVRGLFIVFGGAALIIFIFRPRIDDVSGLFRFAAIYPYFLWHSATLFLALLILVSLIVKLPFKSAFWVTKKFSRPGKKIEQMQQSPSFQQFDASRRIFLQRSMYGLTALSFGGSAYGLLVGKNSYEVTEAEYAIANLPPQFDGFTVGLITDVHSSLYMTKEEMDEYVRAVNSLGVDLIVVDGDFVNSAIREVYPFAESFSELKAPYGAYGVMGNHDFYNENPDLVAKVVDDCGVRLLRNDKAIIEKNGGKLYLIGVDDVGRAHSSQIKLAESIGHAPLDIPRILMCHRPYYLEEAASHDIDLVLSGHTHGGQIVLGRLGDVVIAPASIASKYVWGNYELGNTKMYVSRGIGTVGLPIRINCPPEITRIRLVRPKDCGEA